MKCCKELTSKTFFLKQIFPFSKFISKALISNDSKSRQIYETILCCWFIVQLQLHFKQIYYFNGKFSVILTFYQFRAKKFLVGIPPCVSKTDGYVIIFPFIHTRFIWSHMEIASLRRGSEINCNQSQIVCHANSVNMSTNFSKVFDIVIIRGKFSSP